MSASVPADMMATAIPRLYAVTTHCRPDSPTLKSDWMAGNATFTISASRKIMKRPRPVAARVKRCVLVIGRSKVSHRLEFRPAPFLIENAASKGDKHEELKGTGYFSSHLIYSYHLWPVASVVAWCRAF